MSSFLDTLTFLTPAQRAALEDAALDEPVAFAHVTVAILQAEPYGLKLGHASRLLAAAGVGGPSGAKPSAVNVTFEAPDQRARIDRALEAAATDPSKAAELADLGVEEVVLDGAGKVDPPKTRAMRVHAASGAHVGPTWQGQRIVNTRSLSTPTIYRCPPTGAPLQDGRAEDTGIPWAELGLEGLRAAGFGYDNNMFRGMADEAVFEGLKPGAPLRQRVEARILALGVKADALDDLVIVRPRQDLAPTPVRRSPSSLPGSLASNLTRLLLDLFSAEELRSLLLGLPFGKTYLAELPGGAVSPAHLMSSAADILQRHGAIDSTLRERLIMERPKRSGQIDAVFSAAGIS